VALNVLARLAKPFSPDAHRAQKTAPSGKPHMATRTKPRIRIGIGGWTYAPWRGVFYPQDLTQKRELEYASRQLSTIEINGTFYGLQKPESYMKWHDETPDDFVFSLKAPRYATNRRVLAEAGDSIERFFGSGLTHLKNKLGPINWQFATTKQFDAEDFEAFLTLLPKKLAGHTLRHAVEVRHESFRSEVFVALARKYGVAIVLAADGDYPQIANLTAPFVYARIMGTTQTQAQGYSKEALDAWAERARRLAAGTVPEDLEAVEGPAGAKGGHDVYLYVISGFKEHNPAAAKAIIERL
jgi:uncharacterized protein YecE (DUF72 family)